MGERPSPRASAGFFASPVRTSEASAPRALPAAPGAANLHFPRAGLSSGQREQPSQARTRPAEPAALRRPLGPRQRGWAWARTATAPSTRAGEQSEPHPRRRLRTYLQGTVGLLDSGRGPEGRRRGGRSPSPGPPGSLGVRDGAGRGRTPGGLRPASAARRGVARTWLSPQHQAVAAAAILPSTPCRRRRRPPRVSRMWAFPGVACAGAEDWGLQAARWGRERALGWWPLARLPRARVSIACGLQSSGEWSRYHRILAPHRDYECGSHRERAVSSAPRPTDVWRQDV